MPLTCRAEISTIKTNGYKLCCCLHDVTNCTENAEVMGIVVTSGNVHVSKSEGGALHIEMNGGHLNGHYMMSSVSFSNIVINSDCLGKVRMNEKEVVHNKTSLCQHQGILAVLPEERRLLLELDVLKLKEAGKEVGNVSLPNYLSTEDMPLLQDMVETLQNEGGKKWSTLSRDYLLQKMLQQHKNLMQFCTHADLNIIAKIVKKYTFKDIFKKNVAKVFKADSICKLFGAMSRFEKKNNYSISSLRDLAMREVNEIPHSLLQVVYAKTVLCNEKGSWNQWTTIHMKAYIPIVKDEVDLFYFLEYSEAHSQLEPRMTDHTHMLTNLRSLVCHKGLVNVKRSAFVCITEEHPGVLSKAIVIANLDKQSVAIARKLFSVQVENLLERNGDHHEALFVCLVRNWYLACDQRGMSANDRVNNLWAFYAYLCHNVDFDSFPCPGSYIKGIPAVIFL